MKTQFHPFQPTPFVTSSNKTTHNQRTVPVKGKFAETLQESMEGSIPKLSLSKHAQIRLQQRNIDIQPETWKKVEEKVQEAKKMGVKDSLVLLQNAALIVSVKNNVVVTAMGREEANSQIFTNINGTILMD